MITLEQKDQFNELLHWLTDSLDITKRQFENAVKSYTAIGEHLSKEDSLLANYDPEILPQGSFMLGTMIKPISGNDELDIDLVCQLKGKNPSWTQKTLKQKVGDQIKSNQTYEEMLDDEGRRCWTLKYRKNSENDGEKYHMDILPAIVDRDYRLILEKAFSGSELDDIDKLAIRITDREALNYNSETNHHNWLKSNPFGYAKWFYNRAEISTMKRETLLGSIKPVPRYQNEKLPLQRIVQILKRHRDIMFDGDEDKPISIIITTLAAKAYQKEIDIYTAIENVINKMPNVIEKRYSVEHGRDIEWVSNPVNDEENFADKWPDNPTKRDNFYEWMRQLGNDFKNTFHKPHKFHIQKYLSGFLGEDIVNQSFDKYSKAMKEKRERGDLRMAKNTGLIGSAGAKIQNHNFHG